ncbi:MAG: transferrin receptor-like dimerization domain-containing protein [Chitinophagaceae bacterium]
MKKIALFICLGILNSNQTLTAQGKQLTGFDSVSSLKERQLEANFDQLLSRENIGKIIKELSAKPHHIGSAGGEAVAKAVSAYFKTYGWDTKIETYQVLFPTPITRVLEMTSPKVYKAVLKEPALKEDATSGQADQLPTYNCWSADGDVSGELVYVNFGLPEDYERLETFGISVKDKIVIARYGRSWRGIKPKVAQEHGALGCIIYSDPHEDGYFQGDVYPGGAFKNENGVQRGSVMDMVIYPGDPLTPNVGATESAKRLERSQATNLLKIPVLPISYRDAQPLLAALEGPVAPEDWRGSLPFTYHIGPGKSKVHLKLSFEWKLRPAFNVIATIKGEQFPDQWVIRGNHHDAWVNGAGDPVSGLAAMLEEAKAIGEMVKKGFKPKRSLLYCAWDGEEPGLMGSTEWAEDHGSELQQKAVAYINSDGNGRGFLGAGGSHAFEPLLNEIAADVIDPQTNVPVLERRKASDVVKATTPKAQKDLLNKKDINLSALGSGSDYSSFLQHLGVPSLNLGFGGEDPGGEYHSVYDSFDDYVRFKDSSFDYGVALSKTAGRFALRLANADVLPFDFRNLYKTISGYTTELISFTDQLRENTSIENQVIKTNKYKLANDPTKSLKAPVSKTEVPYLDFSALQNALLSLEKSTNALSDSTKKDNITGKESEAFNKALFQAEQQLLTMDGLPRRAWYKHTIYAPGFYTGYGVKTLPGIREAIEQRNWKEAQEQIGIVAGAISNMSAHLQKLAFRAF